MPAAPLDGGLHSSAWQRLVNASLRLPWARTSCSTRSKLPYRNRAALVLRYYEGLSHAEIAEVLSCREGTVASLVHRGIAELRRVIET